LKAPVFLTIHTYLTGKYSASAFLFIFNVFFLIKRLVSFIFKMSEEEKRKPSGSFYRKRKAKRAATVQAKALKRFLKTETKSQIQDTPSRSQPQPSNQVQLERLESQEQKDVDLFRSKSEKDFNVTDKELPQVIEEVIFLNNILLNLIIKLFIGSKLKQL
jgi:FtsZ-interacting cell division protein YlmF